MTRKAFILIMAVVIGSMQFRTVSAQDYTVPQVTLSKEKIRIDGKLYFSHIVLEKQTLYSISKAYGVTVEQIYEANPNLRETGLKKNSIILIPANEEEEKTDKEIRQEQKDAEKQKKREEKQRRQDLKKNYIIHTVKWFEDLDVIAEKYGVSVEEIIQVNDLKGRKLDKKQKLKIPIVPKETPALDMAPAIRENNEDMTTVDMTVIEKEQPAQNIPKKDINTVVMLPFNASGEKKSESSMDFYSGVLLAAKELGEQGINIDISTYDTGNGSLPITRERLMQTDLIIGPFASQELSDLLAKTPENKFVISPLDHRAELLTDTYSNLIQVPSSPEAQYEDMVNWIKDEMSPGDPVIIMHEKGVKGQDDVQHIKEILDRKGLGYSTFSYSILEGRGIVNILASQISKTNTNRILVVSDSEAFANDVIRNFNVLQHSKFDVVLYCNSKIRSYETADFDNLHNIGTRVSLSYYTDYDNPQVQNFLMKYRALYNSEPSAFAYQGYDTMTYFINLCSKYGENWPEMLSEEEARMLQSTFKFTKKTGGGYVNTATRRIIYNPDFSITEVK